MLRPVVEDLGFERLIAAPFGLGRECQDRVHHPLVEGGRLLFGHRRVIAMAAERSRLLRLGAAGRADDQRRRHPRLCVSRDLAVERVRAGFEAAQVERRRTAGLDVGRDEVGVGDAEVVHLRTAVGHLDAATDVERRSRQGDGELAEVGVDARSRSCALTAAFVVVAQRQADGEDAGEDGEDGDAEDHERPRVPADPVAAHLALERVDPLVGVRTPGAGSLQCAGHERSFRCPVRRDNATRAGIARTRAKGPVRGAPRPASAASAQRCERGSDAGEDRLVEGGAAVAQRQHGRSGHPVRNGGDGAGHTAPLCGCDDGLGDRWLVRQDAAAEDDRTDDVGRGDRRHRGGEGRGRVGDDPAGRVVAACGRCERQRREPGEFDRFALR